MNFAVSVSQTLPTIVLPWSPHRSRADRSRFGRCAVGGSRLGAVALATPRAEPCHPGCVGDGRCSRFSRCTGRRCRSQTRPVPNFRLRLVASAHGAFWIGLPSLRRRQTIQDAQSCQSRRLLRAAGALRPRARAGTSRGSSARPASTREAARRVTRAPRRSRPFLSTICARSVEPVSVSRLPHQRSQVDLRPRAPEQTNLHEPSVAAPGIDVSLQVVAADDVEDDVDAAPEVSSRTTCDEIGSCGS